MNKQKYILFLLLFFIYELVGMKYNLFSPSLTILSTITLQNKPQINTENYEKLIKKIIYSNPLYNSRISNYLYSVDIIGITTVISYTNEYFYIWTIKDTKPFDVVANEDNFLGIVEQVTPKITRVRYIYSNSFQIPAKVISNDDEILGFIKTSSKIYFYPLKESKFELYSEVQTAGQFNIPAGIIIGIIYNNREVKIFKDIQKTDQVVVIRKK